MSNEKHLRRRTPAGRAIALAAAPALAASLSLAGLARAQDAQVTITTDRPGTAAAAGSADVAEMQRQIAALQARVNQMEAAQNRVTAAEADAAIARVGAGESRDEAQAESPFLAGWDDGFKLVSEDGNFELAVGFQFQFRSVTNFTDAGGGDDFEDTQNGFEIRRMKVEAEGTAFDPNFFYRFRLAVNRSEGTPELEYAYVGYELTPDVSFLVGQFKDDVYQEESTSSSKQLAVDRSLVNELLGGGLTDYAQGVQLLYGPKESPLKAAVAYHDGLNTDNTNYTNSGGAAGITPDYGVSSRVVYKAFGDYKAYKDFTALGTKEPLLVFGVGGNYSAGGDDSVILHTADVQYEPNGQLGLFAGYYGAYTDSDATDGYNYGVMGQAGYLLTEGGPWEVFGRYSLTKFDDEGGFVDAGDEDTYNEITGGLNYYFEKHAAKVTVDVTYLPDGTPGVSGVGFRASDEDEIVIRGQFQLLL